MKLIVLYGPDRSGKTTTLKMVYDELKKINVLETNQFDYIDKEPQGWAFSLNGVDVCRHDFRDILFVDRTRMLQFVNDNNVTYNESECIVCNCDNFEKTIKKIDMEKNAKKIGLAQNIYPYSKNNTIQSIEERIDELKLQKSQMLKSIGIATQGDYGYGCKQPAKDVYQLLNGLKRCDTIICACSYMPQNQQNSPLNCVIDFVRHNSAQICTIVIVVARQFPVNHKCVKTPIELRRANIILHNL